jgi:hypothetical protein
VKKDLNIPFDCITIMGEQIALAIRNNDPIGFVLGRYRPGRAHVEAEFLALWDKMLDETSDSPFPLLFFGYDQRYLERDDTLGRIRDSLEQRWGAIQEMKARLLEGTIEKSYLPTTILANTLARLYGRHVLAKRISSMKAFDAPVSIIVPESYRETPIEQIARETGLIAVYRTSAEMPRGFIVFGSSGIGRFDTTRSSYHADQQETEIPRRTLVDYFEEPRHPEIESNWVGHLRAARLPGRHAGVRRFERTARKLERIV